MKEVIVASKNKGKIDEIEYVLNHLSENQFHLKTMTEVGINDDIVEDGTTFEENALIKARYLHKLTGKNVMADDSGLEVDALDGAPGIYSARFAGENSNDADRNKKLLDMLKDVPFTERTGRFVCVIAYITEDGTEYVARGTFDGIIAMREIGSNGFGYDPLLYIPERGCTVACLTPVEKNEYSHRANALRKLNEMLA